MRRKKRENVINRDLAKADCIWLWPFLAFQHGNFPETVYNYGNGKR